MTSFQRSHCKNCSCPELVQALVISRLDYSNALLAGLPSCTIKPVHMIQNAAARLVFTANPKRPMSHLSFSHCTGSRLQLASIFKTLILAYRTATGSPPSYFDSLMTIYIPSRSLRSVSERRLVVPSRGGTKSLSRKFSFTVPGCMVQVSQFQFFSLPCGTDRIWPTTT